MEGLTKLNDEVALEVRQRKRAQVRVHAIRVVAGDLSFCSVHLSESRDAGARGFYDNEGGIVSRKCESQIRAACGRGHLRANPARLSSVHRNRIIVRLDDFIGMAEGKLAVVWRSLE